MQGEGKEEEKVHLRSFLEGKEEKKLCLEGETSYTHLFFSQ